MYEEYNLMTNTYYKSIVGMMDLGNPRIFVTYGKDRFGPSGYIC